MTTLSLVGAGGATPSLPELPAEQPDDFGRLADALGLGSAARSGGDSLALFGASHSLHPLAQQAFVAQGGTAVAGAHANACKVPDAATRVYDVAQTSKADIEALKKSCDPAQQRLGHTIENAKVAYGDLLAKGARIVVTLNAGNGREPVMTLMGPGFDPKLPARIHTHYHGDNATVADPVGSKAGQNSRIRETVARDPQTVFVLPECQSATPTADSPTHDNYYHADWSNVKSQAQTTDDALKAAGITKVGRETVSVHSRGGEVIQKLMHDDPSGGSLRASRLELHDSLYGSQGAVVAWGHTDNGKRVDKVIYVHGTNEGGRDKEIAKTFKGSYIRIDVGQQRPLNDKNNPVVYDGKDAARDDHIHGKKGHEGVRQFNPNAHYQTTGRFLAIWPLPN
ncbi:MAG TPA: hypothetical protein VFU71_11085 [Burkholderiaceae bacterium]|nr:hypothetical protein [Burkholderiaceae bacterium]